MIDTYPAEPHIPTPPEGPDTASPDAIRFGYTNWRGEHSVRTATPLQIRWGTTEWHPTGQWLLKAFDHDKQAEREFALQDCDFTWNTGE